MSRRIALGVVPALLLACTTSHDDLVAAYESEHTAGEPIWENSTFSWAKVDQVPFSAGEKTAPDGHVVTARTQAWVDRYDAIVRAKVRAKHGQELVAPKPVVRTLLDPQLNANIRPAVTCIGTANKPDLAPDGIGVFFTPSTHDRISASEAGGPCQVAHGWGTDPAAAASAGLTWFRTLPGAATVRIGDVVSVESRDVFGVASTSYRSVAVLATSPFVSVNVGLVTEMSEASAAVVIAHELGHYYRAHGTTAVRERYDFWFDRDEHVPERPTPVTDPSYAADYERLRLPRFAAVTDAPLHPRLAPALLRWLMAPAMIGSVSVCKPAVDALVDSGAASSLLSPDDRYPLAVSARDAYRTIARAIRTCSPSLTFTSWGASSALVRAVNDFAPALASGLPADLTGKTLADVLEALETRARQLDAEAPKFLTRLAQNRIGFYTDEQEADDLAMELAAAVGITPDETVNAFVTLMTYTEREVGLEEFTKVHGYSAAECKAQLAAGFRGPAGDAVHVTMGDISMPHHALCYRVFNLFREKQAHRYEVATPWTPPDATPWADVQRAAKELLAPRAKVEPSPAPAPPPAPAPAPPEEPAPSAPEESIAAPADPVVVRKTTTSSCSASPAPAPENETAIGAGLAALMAIFRRRRQRRAGA